MRKKWGENVDFCCGAGRRARERISGKFLFSMSWAISLNDDADDDVAMKKEK